MSAVDTGAETSRVLAANAAFYDAFRRKDITRMKALWSDDEPVFCIHPGWAPLAGRESVIGSFAAKWAPLTANSAAVGPLGCSRAQEELTASIVTDFWREVTRV